MSEQPMTHLEEEHFYAHALQAEATAIHSIEDLVNYLEEQEWTATSFRSNTGVHREKLKRVQRQHLSPDERETLEKNFLPNGKSTLFKERRRDPRWFAWYTQIKKKQKRFNKAIDNVIARMQYEFDRRERAAAAAAADATAGHDNDAGDDVNTAANSQPAEDQALTGIDEALVDGTNLRPHSFDAVGGEASASVHGVAVDKKTTTKKKGTKKARKAHLQAQKQPQQQGKASVAVAKRISVAAQAKVVPSPAADTATTASVALVCSSSSSSSSTRVSGVPLVQQAVTTLPLEQEGAESNESSQVFTLKIGLCIFPVSYQPAAQDAQTVADQLLYEMQPVLESTTNKASTLAEAEEQAVLIAYRTIKEIKIPNQGIMISGTHEGGLMGISAEPAFGGVRFRGEDRMDVEAKVKVTLIPVKATNTAAQMAAINLAATPNLLEGTNPHEERFTFKRTRWV